MHIQEPFDPMCERYARDIPEYDSYIYTSQEELDAASEEDKKDNRAAYVISDEGTYNSETEHFLCDECYIKAGMPSSEGGWVCP